MLVIGLFALTFIFQNFEIPSSSMEKTLLVGDHVLVDRITLAPPAHWPPFIHYRNVQRGDVIFPKSTTPSRMQENFEIFDFELGERDMATISGLHQGEEGRTGPNPDQFDHVPD